jgi:hypothetical protein
MMDDLVNTIIEDWKAAATGDSNGINARGQGRPEAGSSFEL